MKLAALVLTLAACGGSQAPATTSRTSSSSSNGSSPNAVNAVATTGGNSSANGQTVTTDTVNKRPDYSCFSYTSRNSRDQRTACMRSADCGPYLEQAKQIGGIVQVTGCANASVVFCFGTGDEEVCQPTQEACTAERTLLLKKGTSVSSDCTKI